MRLDATTGAIEVRTNFWYGDDLFLTDTGSLLVGSRALPAGILSQDLQQTGSLGNSSQMFVTEYVPEPAMPLFFIIGALLLAYVRSFSRAGCSKAQKQVTVPGNFSLTHVPRIYSWMEHHHVGLALPTASILYQIRSVRATFTN